MNKQLKKGGAMALFTVLVIAAVIVVNLIVGTFPAKYRRVDLSSNQLYKLSDTSKNLLSNLDQDVTIYIVADPDMIDERIQHFVELYGDASSHIKIEEANPVLHPDILNSLGTETNTIFVTCESTGKNQSIAFSDIIQIDTMSYYQYGQYKETAFDGEGQITSAISNVTSSSQPTVYTLSGHQESSLSSQIQDSISKSGLKTEDLNLMTDGAIPDDCDLLLINYPQTDLSQDEVDLIQAYLNQGGNVFLLTGVTESGTPNLTALCAQYGMDLKNGYVADTASGHFYGGSQFNVIPTYDFSAGLLTNVGSKTAALLVQPSGMTLNENLRDGLTVKSFLTTSDQGVLVDPVSGEQTIGTYVLGATASEEVNVPAEETQETASDSDADGEETVPTANFTVITAPGMADDSLLSQFPSLTNLTIFMNAVTLDLPEATALAIPTKSLEVTYNMISSGGLWSALFIIVIPVIFLIAGFVIWMKRRKL